MLTADYQEFANPGRIGHRDNTVIFGRRTGRCCRNRPGVARLPRRQTSTKAELSAYARAQAAARNQFAGRICPLSPTLRSTRAYRHPLPYGAFLPYGALVIDDSSGRL